MASVLRSRFGQLLRSYRMAAGLTQEQLAARAGVSLRGISDLERGVNRASWLSTALALADALGLDPAQRERLLAARQRVTPLAEPVSGAHSPSSARFPTSARLIGRIHEQSRIERLLTRDGAPMLLFYGEPGIGKSRLLQDAAERAQHAGWTVLHGGSQQSDGQYPYAPLLQMLERSLAEQPPAQRRQALKGCEWMVRLLPELADVALTPAQSWQLAPEQERRLIFAAVGRYLARLADPSGVLLVLDDLQWATPDALSLLVELLRSAPASSSSSRLRVVAASRDAQLDASHPLPGMVLDLARDGLVSRVRLGPLEMKHADTLLHAALSDIESIAHDEREALIQNALARAAGVPLFLMSFAHEIRASGEAGDYALAATAVPWDVSEMTRQRVTALDPAAREVVSVAAVYGRETPLSVLVSASGLTRQQVVEGIEGACGAGLLEETRHATCVFHHDLVREAVVANLSAARKEMLHQLIGAALEADPRRTSVEPLAFHFSQSADTDRATMYLERAGDQALAVRAYGTAEACYRDALGHIASGDAASARGRVQEKLGSLLMGGGKYRDAIDAFEEAVSSYERMGDVDGVGRTVAQIVWAHVRGGTAAAGLSRIEPLLSPAAMASLMSSTQMALWRAYAVLLFARNRYDDQLASARRAVSLARETRDTGALAKSMRLEGLALVLLGRLDEALPVLLETIGAAELVGDLDSLSAALNDAAAVYRERGELTLSLAHSSRAVEVADQMGDPTAMAFFNSSHGENAYLLGDWMTARQAFERAVAVARDIGSSWVGAYPLMNFGMLEVAEGHDDAGMRQLHEARDLAERAHDLQALHHIHAGLAERDLMRGAAADALQWLVSLPDPATVANRDATALLPLVSWARLNLDDLAGAAAALKLCIPRAEATGVRLVMLNALLAQARLHMRQAEWPQAEQALDETLTRSRAMPYPYAEAKARFLYGQLHAATGKPAQAREQYERALAMCERLGERLYRAQIEQALSALHER